MNPSLKPASFEPGKDVRLSPRFRVFPIGGERRGFRLEQVFWNALAAIAERNRRDLAGEIAATLRRAPAELNASATLRASAVADLMDLWELAEAKAARPSWGKVIKALPYPAFAATRSLTLAALNDSMRVYLERRGLHAPVGPGRSATVELADGAIVQLLKAEPDGYVICNAVFRSGQHRALSRVRVVQVDGDRSEPRLMLGFPEQG
jgi:predicted DNA-binding ribbon-helix-helix protein